jgi:hypothetical protein
MSDKKYGDNENILSHNDSVAYRASLFPLACFHLPLLFHCPSPRPLSCNMYCMPYGKMTRSIPRFSCCRFSYLVYIRTVTIGQVIAYNMIGWSMNNNGRKEATVHLSDATDHALHLTEENHEKLSQNRRRFETGSSGTRKTNDKHLTATFILLQIIVRDYCV